MIGLLGAVGDFLPLGVAVSLSPFPVVAITVILAEARGAAAGVGFAAGWTATLAVVTLLLTFAIGELDGAGFALAAWVQVLIGLALVAVAVGKWRKRPRGDAPPQAPGWMRTLGSASPGRAATFGAMLAVNPKNLALAAAAVSSIAYRDLSGPVAAIAALIFVALGSLSVIGAVLLRALGGPGAASRLEALKRFMLRYNPILMMVLFLFLGLKILGDGLAELGS